MILYRNFKTALSLLAISGGLIGSVFAQHDPVQQYQGKTGRNLAETQQWWPARKKAPQGAPNVVWILLDDVGYGAVSTFGGLIETPTLDNLANNGLRYTNFHTTAICSPTRAALLTGRNSHSVHMGLFPNTAIGAPGYDGFMPFEKATIAEILRENGYNTYAVGKWHLTPPSDATALGPFNRWPTGRGFDHYYGFLGGSTDQWHPTVYDDTRKVEPEADGKHFTTRIADKAIGYIAEQKSIDAAKPFFLYFAPGAGHAPHQVAKEWSDKYKGKFDSGWDKYREKVLEQQIRLGVVPKGTVLPPRNAGIKPWDSLSVDEKKVFARFMEVYAGFVSHTDYEIGRVVDYLKKINQLENTLIFVSVGDNGASKEGTLTGIINRNDPSWTDQQRFEANLQDLDKLGTEASRANYPLGWAMAANTPFKQWKQDANSEGGTRNPLIVFYPKGIKEKGGIRDQYAHLIDILPTTVELIGAQIPAVINGYPQERIEGTSLAYSINNTHAPSRHTVQHYEIMGSRSIYKDGWKAGTLHKKGEDFSKDKWELYNLNEDFNERFNVAEKYPEKLKELQELFDSEAARYNIYPLKDGTEKELDYTKLYVNNNATRTVFYPEAPQVYGVANPITPLKSYVITADAEIGKGTEGVLFAVGGRFSGVSLFIKDGKFQVTNNAGITVSHLASGKPVPAGKVSLKYVLNYTEAKNVTDPAGTHELYINDIKVAEAPIVKAQANIRTNDEINVGRDLITQVSDRYKGTFPFNGKLNVVVVETGTQSISLGSR
ncbi:arylsulfatase [Fulvivirgaceae bacterium PWU4]|uniref:Arylsulfatase n=1 Tax=Chryseosolibacter histidini TaxID=2782349 RepID=A0AAP2GIX6_9BACT|nr:arylsulfatase [Chryseosolibacter histidini]MBT1697449.1 arylsulfatase [Chryseosolibacter histidini]